MWNESGPQCRCPECKYTVMLWAHVAAVAILTMERLTQVRRGMDDRRVWWRLREEAS